MKLIFIVALVLFIFKPTWAETSFIDEPRGCMLSASYPCGAHFINSYLHATPESKIQFQAGSKAFWRKASDFTLVSGKAYVSPEKTFTYKFVHHHWQLRGSVIIEAKSGGVDLYQIKSSSDYQVENAKIAKVEVHSGFKVGMTATSKTPSIPYPIAEQEVSSIFLGVYRPSIDEVKEIAQAWSQRHMQAAEAFREVASSIEDQKETKRQARVQRRNEINERNQKYKDLFRKRHFRPEAWSEFINDPDLSP